MRLTVLAASAIAFFVASSQLFGELPINSTISATSARESQLARATIDLKGNAS